MTHEQIPNAAPIRLSMRLWPYEAYRARDLTTASARDRICSLPQMPYWCSARVSRLWVRSWRERDLQCRYLPGQWAWSFVDQGAPELFEHKNYARVTAVRLPLEFHGTESELAGRERALENRSCWGK